MHDSRLVVDPLKIIKLKANKIISGNLIELVLIVFIDNVPKATEKIKRRSKSRTYLDMPISI